MSQSKCKAGDSVSLDVEALSPRGLGLASLNGRRVSVLEALPGDRVQATVTRVRPEGLEARLGQVERASPQRVSPLCEHFGTCGGCQLQHLSYPAQVEWRRQLLEQVLAREMPALTLPPIQVLPMESPWGHRAKMEFTFGQDGERVTLGLHPRASFDRIIDVRRCEIAPEEVNLLLPAIRELVNGFPLRAYNPKTHDGFWRYAVIRTARQSGQMMLVLITNEGPREPLESMARILPQRVPSLRSFYWGVSGRVSDVAQPERLELLCGAEALEDQVGHVRYRFGPSNFVQPNHALVERVYETIRTQAGLTGSEAVYDLYCGIGLIGLYLARQARVVYGVESEPANVAWAERNAAANGIANALFLCGRVEDVLRGRALFKAGAAADLIVLDPPRAGLHRDVTAPLLEALAPRLAYLSCNPASLGRDLKVLLEREARYRLTSLHLFDFFPHTDHQEVLAFLQRRV